MQGAPFTIREDSVAIRLGVQRSWVRKNRWSHHYGDLWEFGPNRAVLWSEKGVAWLASKLEKSAPHAAPDRASAPEKPATQPEPTPPPQRVLETLVVVRCNFPNRRVLHARRNSGELVTVGAVKADLFWPGFLLLAAPHPAAPGTWTFEGNPNRPEVGRRHPKGKHDRVWPRSSPTPGGGFTSSAS
jgi:hypothetical protein